MAKPPPTGQSGSYQFILWQEYDNAPIRLTTESIELVNAPYKEFLQLPEMVNGSLKGQTQYISANL
jgi:hypothetical protein